MNSQAATALSRRRFQPVPGERVRITGVTRDAETVSPRFRHPAGTVAPDACE